MPHEIFPLFTGEIILSSTQLFFSTEIVDEVRSVAAQNQALKNGNKFYLVLRFWCLAVSSDG